MKRLCLAILLTLVCIFCFASCAEGKYNGELIEIRFLDVGQADAILLRTPDGDVLIDAGSEDSQDTLCARLDQLGVKELLLAVFTHADEDHIGGADGILQAFPVREIWFNGSEGDNESAKPLFDCFQEGETEVRAICEGEILRIGEVSITVLHPFHLISAVGNEGSIVLKVSCGEFDMLLTGDASSEQEMLMLERYGSSQLDCEVYKVGHHGSNTSSSDAFLSAMSPQYAVISCGAGNPYGHPAGEVLARLNNCGAAVLRTDLLGEIVFTTDGHSWSYENAD